MQSLISKNISGLITSLESGEITSEQLTQQFNDQIKLVNPIINAVILTKFESALKEARQRDLQRKQGITLGPLHGIPMTIKDMLNCKGDVTTFGTLGLKHNVASADASLVQRLRESGAILLGKTNLPELAHAADTDNLLFGRTANPYDPNHSSGGSSGGGAAAVAAMCTPFDIGSDAGGSLRIPAHYCGVATIRPTLGRVPSTGVVMGLRKGLIGRLATDGPIAKTTADLELLLKIIAGEDGKDPLTIPAPLLSSNSVKVSSLKLAVFDDNGVLPAGSDTQSAIRALTKSISSSVAHISFDRPEGLKEAYELFFNLLGAAGSELFSNSLHAFGTKTPSPMLKTFMALLETKKVSTADFLRNFLQWDEWQSKILQFMQNYDVILSPVTATAAIHTQQCMWDPENFPSISYCWPWSLTRCPIVVVRVGTSNKLPIGVQIIAKPWHDHVALAVGHLIEQKGFGWVAPQDILIKNT